MAEKSDTVCITGGTGFIGSWLVMKLLNLGYFVRTTIRSNPPGKIRDLSFLTNLPGASERLEIFCADLSDPESFRAAIEGCTGVFHVAASVDLNDSEPEEMVTKRSINGALGILKACLNSKTVRKVVYTPSASAVTHNGINVDVMDESFWSNVDYIRALKSYGGSYMISKTLTERAVLEFSKKHDLEVVTLIPSLVVGPFICPKIPASNQDMLGIITGKHKKFKSFTNMLMVHVDDVASAHIFLFENPKAEGRYNCSLDVTTLECISEFLSAKYPELQMPNKDSIKEIEGYKMAGLSTKKLLDSGFKFKYGAEETLVGAIQCCKGKNNLTSNSFL